MCNCTCDCIELEDDLDAMEDEVEYAKGKVSDYQISLTAQEDYTESILGLANSVSEVFKFDDIDDLLDFISDLEELAEKIAAGGLLLARAKLAAAYIALVLAYYVTTAAASVALEALYQKLLNSWSTKLEKRKKKYDKIEEELCDCYSDLTECEACNEEFVDKEECGRECDGCGRWYCTNCFVVAIESAELAAGEAF